MKIYSSATWPVNPPGASPVLTREQLWNGLEVKAHDPRDFVPITACTVIENRGEQGITRRVKFVPNAGPPTSNGEATEVVTYYKPVKVSSSASYAAFLNTNSQHGDIHSWSSIWSKPFTM